MAHYNFNAHELILVIFVRDTVERVCYRMVICYLTYIMFLHYLGKHEPGNCICSVMPCLKSVTALACYIFDCYKPILIILGRYYLRCLCYHKPIWFFVYVCYYFLNLLRVYEGGIDSFFDIYTLYLIIRTYCWHKIIKIGWWISI